MVKTMKKIILFTFLVFIFLGGTAYAACGGSSPNLVAASCSRADVADCITASTYGDTITIPAGNCTWTSGLAIIKDIKIIGTGVSGTTLTMNFPDDSQYEAFFEFTPDATARGNINDLSDSNTFEVTGFTFAGNYMNLKCAVLITNNTTTVIRRVKIHGNKITSIDRTVMPHGEIYGVFYDNELIDSGACKPLGRELSSWDDNPMTLGSGDGWYVEDNTFSFTSNRGLITSGGQGMGQVIRYNTLTGDADLYIDSHGNQTGGIMSTQITEIYGNDFNATTNQDGVDMRGGRVVCFWNKTQDAKIKVREEYFDGASGTTPANLCADAGPQICLDNCQCQKINHSYFFNNRKVSDSSIIVTFIEYDRYDRVNTNNPLELVEDREFWKYAYGGVSGTTGCGCGNALPGTCDGDNEGFWLTDQDCTQIVAANLGANPTTPISGTLYRCTAANTWTAWYTPYTYPHPLRGGSCALSGTATEGINESDIVAGGKTIIFTLTNETWVATIGADNSITSDQIAAITSNRSETDGWNNRMLSILAFGDVTRTSDTVLTIILPAVAAYDISQTEEDISSSMLGTSLASGVTETPTPTDFSIGVEADGGSSATVGVGMVWSAQGRECVYNKNGVELVAE